MFTCSSDRLRKGRVWWTRLQEKAWAGRDEWCSAPRYNHLWQGINTLSVCCLPSSFPPPYLSSHISSFLPLSHSTPISLHSVYHHNYLSSTFFPSSCLLPSPHPPFTFPSFFLYLPEQCLSPSHSFSFPPLPSFSHPLFQATFNLFSPFLRVLYLSGPHDPLPLLSFILDPYFSLPFFSSLPLLLFSPFPLSFQSPASNRSISFIYINADVYYTFAPPPPPPFLSAGPYFTSWRSLDVPPLPFPPHLFASRLLSCQLGAFLRVRQWIIKWETCCWSEARTWTAAVLALCPVGSLLVNGGNLSLKPV